MASPFFDTFVPALANSAAQAGTGYLQGQVEGTDLASQLANRQAHTNLLTRQAEEFGQNNPRMVALRWILQNQMNPNQMESSLGHTMQTIVSGHPSPKVLAPGVYLDQTGQIRYAQGFEPGGSQNVAKTPWLQALGQENLPFDRPLNAEEQARVQKRLQQNAGLLSESESKGKVTGQLSGQSPIAQAQQMFAALPTEQQTPQNASKIALQFWHATGQWVPTEEVLKGIKNPNQPLVTVQNYQPADIEAQKEFMRSSKDTYDKLKTAPVLLRNIEQAKALIPGARGFMGPGGESLLEVAKFLNNRIGTKISTEGIKSAEELRTRIFFNILENLKKMDAQPSQMQQMIMMESLGKLGTDPNALGNMLDAYAETIRDKIGLYNQEVESAMAPPRNIKFPYEPRIRLAPNPTEPSAQTQSSGGKPIGPQGANPSQTPSFPDYYDSLGKTQQSLLDRLTTDYLGGKIQDDELRIGLQTATGNATWANAILKALQATKGRQGKK